MRQAEYLLIGDKELVSPYKVFNMVQAATNDLVLLVPTAVLKRIKLINVF